MFRFLNNFRTPVRNYRVKRLGEKVATARMTKRVGGEQRADKRRERKEKEKKMETKGRKEERTKLAAATSSQELSTLRGVCLMRPRATPAVYGFL